MSFVLNTEQRFTYKDYLSWPADERWEVIEGLPYAMSPAPTPSHQAIVFELARQIGNLLLGKQCRGLSSPIDLILSDNLQALENAETVVQPDLLVVCDPQKIDKRGIRAAPDFIIEVLSPSNASHDQIIKAALYEKHGVREYWVLDPVEKLVTIRVLNASGAYDRVRFVEATGKVTVSIFESFELDLDLVFAAIPPGS
ncbi:MAG: Uma2 family endonuclease [Candidatus Sumerlaeaceae bacterium]